MKPVNELAGVELDAAVAAAVGLEVATSWRKEWDGWERTGWMLDERTGRIVMQRFDGSRSRAGHWEEVDVWSPSTDWDQCGPLLDRFNVRLSQEWVGSRIQWSACVASERDDKKASIGWSAREAICRALVQMYRRYEVQYPASGTGQKTG